MTDRVTAVRYLGGIGRGATRPGVFLCDDGRTYVVKTRLNPQGPRLIPNEWIAFRLGRLLGLPIPDARIVTVPGSAVPRSMPADQAEPLLAGPHFGSLFAPGTIVEPTPTQLAGCANLDQAAAMIAFDIWIKNWDRCWRRGKNILIVRGRESRLVLIDHGGAFTGSHWNAFTLIMDNRNPKPYWGENYTQFVRYIDGPAPFERPLHAINALDDAVIRSAVSGLPAEWGVTAQDAEALAAYLIDKKPMLPGILLSLAPYFPRWRDQLRREGSLSSRRGGSPL